MNELKARAKTHTDGPAPLCLKCRWWNGYRCTHPEWGDVIKALWDGVDHSKCVYYAPRDGGAAE